MKLTLTSTKQETSDVTSFIFEPDQEFSWQPGQFLHYTFPHQAMDDRGEERWFTISAAPYEGHVMLTTRFAEDRSSSFKTALKNLPVGSSIEADDPEGEFVIEDFSQKYILLAGGIGVTPFRSMLLQYTHDHNKLNADLLYANRNNEFVFEGELTQVMPQQPDFHIHKIVERHISEGDIRGVAPDLNVPYFYISGPKPMAFHYQDLLKGLGVPEEHIKLDKFPNYNWDPSVPF